MLAPQATYPTASPLRLGNHVAATVWWSVELQTASVPSAHTLRAGDEEGSHAQAYNEPLSRPNWAEAHNGLDARGVHSREDEESKRGQDSTEADYLAKVTGIQEPTNRVGEEENKETL
jgi:hypothetical protein